MADKKATHGRIGSIGTQQYVNRCKQPLLLVETCAIVCASNRIQFES